MRYDRPHPLSRREMISTLAAGLAGWRVGHLVPQSGPIHTRPIPSAAGETVPVIGLGTWQTFDVGNDPEDRAPLLEVLRLFLQRGGRVIDSSPMYGRAESVVGQLLGRLDVTVPPFLATKVWTRGRAAGVRQMETSMRRMRARRMDLMQVHNLVDWRTHLDTLRAWKAEGRVRYVGITHYQTSAFSDLARIIRAEPLDFVQLNFSIATRVAEEHLLPLAAERGVAVIVNRPYEGGSLFRRVRGRQLPAWASEFDCQSWGQFFLKYIVSHPQVTCAIPATSNPEHMADNMQAGYGRLPDQALRRRMVEALTG